MLTPLAEAETSQIGGMVGERGDSDMEPGRGSLSCGLPPCLSSFLNFDLLFWNQIFTCRFATKEGKRVEWVGGWGLSF